MMLEILANSTKYTRSDHLGSSCRVHTGFRWETPSSETDFGTERRRGVFMEDLIGVL